MAQEPTLVRFAVIGDSGSGDEHQYGIARQMLAWHNLLPYDLTLTLGDNIYGSWSGSGGGNKKEFKRKFDRPYAALLARGVIFRAALGNHDVESRGGQDLIEAYDRFHIDGPLGYYHFTAGEWHPGAGAAVGGVEEGPFAPLVEFFVLNTVRLANDAQDQEQLAWFKHVLGASRARWRIVGGHHPLYSTGKQHGGDIGLREALEPILQGIYLGPAATSSPAVQVVFAGHDHIYERFHPQQGIAYFVCGASGQLRAGNARPSPEVAAFEDRQRVFMLWEVTPQELRFRAINDHGEAFDCGTVRPAGKVESADCPALASVR